MTANTSVPPAPKLLQQVRDRCRTLHYSLRTEQAYVNWIKRFILFHGKRHPKDMGAPELEAFLTHLATDRNVAASTQNVALASVLFLYREVLEQELPWLQDVTRAKRPERLPTVLSTVEISALLQALEPGPAGLVAQLLYGTGMRLMEGLRLRVKDVDLKQRQITIREGKGGKDRVTVLPDKLLAPLQAQLKWRREVFDRDKAEGREGVFMPDALAVKYPNAAREWAWQYVFPADGFSTDPRSGAVRRHHLSEQLVQRCVKRASQRADISKPVSPHVL